MKSGLEDRNNKKASNPDMDKDEVVSMKSGLEDRNNVYTQNLDVWHKMLSQ